jgi:transposase
MTNKQDSLKRKFLLLILARQLDNVDMACKIMGYSREEYAVLKARYAMGVETALTAEDNPDVPEQELVSPETKKAVLTISAQRPRLAQAEVVSELLKQGVTVSPEAVLKIWKEYGLNDGE